MTKDTAIREQARAVFLAALMVLSVMVGTVALSGGAAAAVTTATVADGEAAVSGGNAIAISGSTDDSGTVYAFIDDGSVEGEYDSDDSEATLGEPAEDGSFEGQISNPGESGEYDIHIVQKGTDGLQEGDTGGVVKTITVDADEPNFGAEDTRQVTTSTPTLTVPLSDANTSVNESTIEVDIKEGAAGDGESYIHKVNAPSSDDDGISYDSSADEVTIDFGESELKELTDGTYDVTISAEDAVGNSNSTNFDLSVDTGAPTFALNTPEEGSTVSSATQPIKVEFAGNVNASTAEINVDGPGDYSVTNTSDDTDDDGISYTENAESPDTFTVSPDSGTVPALETGTYTVTVSAEDEFGNANSAEFTISVDVSDPIVEAVGTNQSEYYGDDTTMLIGIAFNESVDASTVSADVHVDDETNSITTSNFEQGDDDDASTVYATYDLSNFDDSENGSAEVVVTGGEDVTGNKVNLTAGSNSTTFAIDTVAPNPQIDGGLPGTLTGLVDIEQYVSVSEADGNEAQIGWKVDDGDVTWFDNAASVDTRDITEGEVTIVAKATDENGTSTTADADVTVDNFEPSVELEYPDHKLGGNEDGVEYSVEEVVEISHNGTYEVTDYGYYKLSGSESAGEVTEGDITFSDSFEVSEDGTYVFAVKINGNTYFTGPMEAVVFDSEELDITVEQNSEDAGELNVTVTSDVELDSMNLTVQSIDDHYKQSSETFSSPDEIGQTQLEDGTWEYTVVYDTPRDGVYVAEIDNASKGILTVSNAGNDDAIANGSAPEITDADVVGLDSNGNTVVNVRFSEPIWDVDSSDFTFGDDRADVVSVTDTGMTGEVRITFDREIQTGDDEAILAVKEDVYNGLGHNDGNIAEEDYIDSVELDLQKGLNYVSVPLETGSVSLDELKKEGELDDVEAIWAYDDGEWVSYDPSADDNELTALEGGDGYVVKTESDTKVDVRGYTRLAISEGAPEVEGIEAGWNLVGHYHEESKDATDSLGFTPDEDIGVIGQGDGYALERVSDFEPGEGYWVFVREDGNLYTATEDGGSAATPSIGTVSVTDGDDDLVTNGDEVTISVDSASAEAGVHAVVADATNLNGDNEVVLTEREDGSYSTTVTVDRSEAVDSSQPVDVTVIDSYGQTASGSDGIDVDTTAPTASWDSTDFAVSGTYDLTADSTVSGQDSVTYEYSTDGGSTWNPIGDASSWDTTQLNDGDVSVRMTAEDAVGNSASDETTVTVDNVQPAASWDGSFGGSTVSGDVDLTAEDTSTNADTTAYEIDNGSGFTDVGDTWDTTLSDDGDVTVRVTVEDDQGNSDTATATVTVDNTAPSTQSLTGAGTNTLTLTFSESVYANGDGTGALSSGDFTFVDDDSGGVQISSVTHNAGGSTVTIELSGSATTADSVNIVSPYYDETGNEANSDTTETVVVQS